MSVQLNAGTGGSVLAADTVSGEEHQLTKIEFGTAGNATPVSTSNPLPVVQTGTPGLPTGAATETTLAAAAASLAVMDDWDETNRCAVNPISGQAGVAAGAGAVGATVQRVTLASDDPGVASLASLDAKAVTARTADYDSGAGTVTTQFMGIALPASGGPVAGGTSTNPLRTDPTGTTTQPTSDGGTSFTIDSPQLPAVLGQATMANSLPVVIASDQGNIGVTDGGTSLTIDSPQLPTTLGQTTMANGLPVTLASDQSTLPVSLASVPSHPVTNAGTFAVQNTAAIPAGTNNIGDVDVLTVPADPFGTNADAASATGSISAKLRQIATTGIPVTSMPTTTVVGAAAHDAAISGAPVRIGGRAASSTVSAVASGDAVDLVADLNGRQVVAPHTIPENSIVGCTAAITDTSAAQLFAAAGAGIRNFLTSLLVTNSHATVSTLVEVRDGTATVIWRGYALAAGGGFSITFPVPLRGTANTAMNVYCITTGSNVYASGAGYTAP